jgi:hypothetical protein
MRSASFLRFVGPLVILAGVVVACSNDDASSSSVGSSGNGRVSGGTSGSSNPPPLESSSSSGAAPGAIDLDSIVTIKITSDWCQKPPGQCLDSQSFTVDFANSKLTTTTCVELAGGGDGGSSGGTQDAETSKPITSAQLDAVKKDLAGLQSTTYAGSDAGAYDNAKRTLEVTTKTRGVEYFATSDTLCAKPPGTALASGWQELWDTLRSM